MHSRDEPVFARMTLMEGWLGYPATCIRTGDVVRVDPADETIAGVRRG